MLGYDGGQENSEKKTRLRVYMFKLFFCISKKTYLYVFFNIFQFNIQFNKQIGSLPDHGTTPLPTVNHVEVPWMQIQEK